MNKKPIIIGVGVLGVAALGYYAYTRMQPTPQIATTQPLVESNGQLVNPTTGQPAPTQAGAGFPAKATLLAVGQASGWNPGYLNAINLTYSQVTGTANDGDWKMKVIGVNPIATQWTKGSEMFKLVQGTAGGVRGLGLITTGLMY